MSSKSFLIRAGFDRLYAALDRSVGLIDQVAAASDQLNQALLAGKKVLTLGNGGSAADAQHLAAEIVVRYTKERAAYPAIALTTDTSILTAEGNDHGFDTIFRRQVAALAQPGDVVVAFSTSGNSRNVIEAVNEARARGCFVIGFLGRDGGQLKALVDLPLVVEADETARVQEVHMLMYHLLCELFEADL